MRHAQSVFVEMGYGRTTHDMVAEQAGVSRTLLYRYFESKSALYAALFDRIQEKLRERTATIGGPEGVSGPDSLAEFLTAAARVHADDTAYSRVLATSLVDGLREREFAPAVEAWVADLRQVFDRTVARARADGRLRAEDDAEAVANLLFAALWGLGLFGAFMGSEKQVEDAMALFTDRVLPALLPESCETT